VELSGTTLIHLCFVFNRWCKRPAFCGNDYMREVAYCYIEGSFCQRWIYRQIAQQNDEENEGESKTSMYRYNLKCCCKKRTLSHAMQSAVLCIYAGGLCVNMNEVW
jgi:hypothetical protein